jgi:hypothetical protein
MNNEPVNTPYLIEFVTTDLIEPTPTTDAVVITAPNETQAEALFAQEFDSALYNVTNVTEYQSP